MDIKEFIADRLDTLSENIRISEFSVKELGVTSDGELFGVLNITCVVIKPITQLYITVSTIKYLD